MKKFTLPLRIFLFVFLCSLLTAFSSGDTLEDDVAYVHKLLNEHYDLVQEGPLVKRCELQVTNAGFCRYKRYFSSGKVEYFSLNLKKFRDIDFLGDDKRGKLLFYTKGEDVIVQTYKDRKNGDVDSMSTFLAIPMKDIEPEDLINLSERLIKMNALLMAQK